MKNKSSRAIPFWFYRNDISLGNLPVIREFGWHTCPSGSAFSETRDNFMLQFVIDGICHLYVAGATYTVHRGEAFFLPPGIPHRYVADAADPSVRVWIAFSGSDAKLYGDIIQRSGRDEYVFSYHDREKLLDIFDVLFVNRGKTTAAVLNIYRSFFGIISLFGTETAMDSHTDEDTLLVDDIVGYINENLSGDISVGAIADNFGYERTTLYKKFKLRTGVSIQEYIITQRLLRIKRLLIETDLKLQEIAIACGYTEAEAVKKLFLRHEKISPGKYRKLNTSPPREIKPAR